MKALPRGGAASPHMGFVWGPFLLLSAAAVIGRGAPPPKTAVIGRGDPP